MSVIDAPKLAEEPCPECKGSKKCKTCKGRYVLRQSLGFGAMPEPCPACKATGLCPACQEIPDSK